MKYVIIGGAGAMGRITVRDLVEFAAKDAQIVIADYDGGKAETQAEAFRDARVTGVRVDVKNRAATVAVLKDAFAVINSVQYQLNLDVMEAAAEAGCHYIDLGGLFHMTRRQLELDARFKAIGRCALLGMGAAPGITNLCARLAADQLDTVTEIHTRVAGADLTKYEDVPALSVSYSLQTILEEFSFEPAVFTKGKFTFVKAMSGDVPHKFPDPVGVKRPMYTIHSEVATLPLSYASKGVREVSFKIAFDPVFVDRVRFLRDLGMASHEPLLLASGTSVKPIEVANRVAMAQKPARQVGKLRQHEIIRAVVKGTRGKKKETWIVDCHCVGMPEWGVGTDVDTGTPPSIAALMLASGEISATGAVPPEVAVPVKPFFAALRKRRMTVKVRKKSGWGFAT